MNQLRSKLIVRVFLTLLLIPILIFEPFVAMVTVYTLPLFVMLAFTASVENERPHTSKYNRYILITSLYLIGITFDEPFIRSVVVLGLVFSLYTALFETT